MRDEWYERLFDFTITWVAMTPSAITRNQKKWIRIVALIINIPWILLVCVPVGILLLIAVAPEIIEDL